MEGIHLDTIKKEITEKYSEEIDLHELRLRIQGLEKKVTEVRTYIEITDSKKSEEVRKKLSQDCLSLIQSLLLLLN